MTLTEFLLARSAEDEREALEWRNADAHVMEFSHGEPLVHRSEPWQRVLTECEAKRRIVDAFEDERQRKDIYNRDYPLGLLTTKEDLRARLSANARWAGLDVALRALAAVYADHPDYHEAWRP